jgi:hypothetical protein
MNEQLQQVIDGFVREHGASPSELRETVASLTFTLPDDYLELQGYANGAEGFVGAAYLHLYPITELALLNKAYGVAEFAPGLWIFGSSGGGEAFAFDTNGDSVSIIQVPFIPMDTQYAIKHGTTLWDLMKSLAEKSGEPISSKPYRVNPSAVRKEVHDVLPIVFGGNPTDPKNKILLEPIQYAEYVVWWNRRYRQIRGQLTNNPNNM